MAPPRGAAIYLSRRKKSSKATDPDYVHIGCGLPIFIEASLGFTSMPADGPMQTCPSAKVAFETAWSALRACLVGGGRSSLSQLARWRMARNIYRRAARGFNIDLHQGPDGVDKSQARSRCISEDCQLPCGDFLFILERVGGRPGVTARCSGTSANARLANS